MNVFISPKLPDDERKFVISEIQKCYESVSVSSTETRDIRLRIVDISEFENYLSTTPPPICSTAIYNAAEQRIDIKDVTVPECGIINFHLHRKHIAFSGLNYILLENCKKLIRQMGGFFDKIFTQKTNYLISHTMQTERAILAKNHHIQCISPDWLDALINSKNFIPPDDFILKPLAGLVFTFTGVSEEQAHFEHVIQEQGGKISNGLTTQTNAIITNELPTSSIARVGVRRNILFFSPDSIRNIEKGEIPKPIAPPYVPSNIFKGMKFTVRYHNPRKTIEIQQIIRGNGGTTGDDIIITDMNDSSPNCRSIAWLNRCVQTGSILDVGEFALFSPPRELREIPNMTIAVTGFKDGAQLLNIIEGIQMIGANYSKKLTKKVSLLIANKKEGSKFEYAQKWGIRVVTAAALEALANDGPDADLDRYTLSSTSNNTTPQKIIQDYVRKPINDVDENLYIEFNKPLKLVPQEITNSCFLSDDDDGNLKNEPKKLNKKETTNYLSDEDDDVTFISQTRNNVPKITPTPTISPKPSSQTKQNQINQSQKTNCHNHESQSNQFSINSDLKQKDSQYSNKNELRSSQKRDYHSNDSQSNHNSNKNEQNRFLSNDSQYSNSNQSKQKDFQSKNDYLSNNSNSKQYLSNESQKQSQKKNSQICSKTEEKQFSNDENDSKISYKKSFLSDDDDLTNKTDQNQLLSNKNDFKHSDKKSFLSDDDDLTIKTEQNQLLSNKNDSKQSDKKSFLSDDDDSSSKTDQRQFLSSESNQSKQPHENESQITNTSEQKQFLSSETPYNQSKQSQHSNFLSNDSSVNQSNEINTPKITNETQKKVNFLSSDTSSPYGTQNTAQQANSNIAEQNFNFLSSDDEIIDPEVQKVISQASQSSLEEEKKRKEEKQRIEEIERKLREEMEQKIKEEVEKKKEEELRQMREEAERKRREEEEKKQKEELERIKKLEEEKMKEENARLEAENQMKSITMNIKKMFSGMQDNKPKDTKKISEEELTMFTQVAQSSSDDEDQAENDVYIDKHGTTKNKDAKTSKEVKDALLELLD